MEVITEFPKKTYGKLKCFGYIGEEPLFCIGPDWPFFLGLFTVICGLGVLFVFFLCPLVGSITTSIGALVFGFLILNYFLAFIINPGLEINKINHLSQINDEELGADEPDNYCRVCEVYKSPKTEHCNDCNVCIQEYDHHCPWTGKCIGKGNINFFYCFLIGLLLSFVFGIVTMAMQSAIKK